MRAVQRICCARSPTQVKKPRPLPPPAQSTVGVAGMRLALARSWRGRARLRDAEGAMIGRLHTAVIHMDIDTLATMTDQLNEVLTA